MAGPPAAARRYPAAPAAVRLARRYVAGVLRGWGWADAGTAELLVSELVTNAVIHAGGAEVAVLARRWGPGRSVLVEVWDGDPAPPSPRAAGPRAEHWRGLLLVSQLAARWGWYPAEAGGKAVWFLLRALPRRAWRIRGLRGRGGAGAAKMTAGARRATGRDTP
jgi:anti-sigma regulatory factor (Ser/Thr protein kinase)